MYKKLRTAVDIQGNRVEITETQMSDFTIRQDGSVKYDAPPAFFGPDGRRLIPEGRGSFLTPWGIRYQLLD